MFWRNNHTVIISHILILSEIILILNASDPAEYKIPDYMHQNEIFPHGR
jgi:hypothetical protein